MALNQDSNQGAPRLRSEFLDESRLSGTKTRRERLIARHKAELEEFRRAEASDEKYMLDLAPQELHAFLADTHAIHELIRNGNCRIGNIDGAVFKEYGFLNKEDAAKKLMSLGEAWKKEVRVEVSPDGCYGVQVVMLVLPAIT